MEKVCRFYYPCLARSRSGRSNSGLISLGLVQLRFDVTPNCSVLESNEILSVLFSFNFTPAGSFPARYRFFPTKVWFQSYSIQLSANLITPNPVRFRLHVTTAGLGLSCNLLNRVWFLYNVTQTWFALDMKSVESVSPRFQCVQTDLVTVWNKKTKNQGHV